MRKVFCLLSVFLVCFALTGISSCEEKVDGEYGIHVITNPDGTKKVVVEPKGGAIGSGIEVASGAASSVPGPGTLIGYGLSVLFGAGGLVQTVLKRRRESEVEEYNAKWLAEQKAHAETKDALETSHSATNAGLQSFVDSQPAVIGHALLAELDHAHDAADVDPAHQDSIQPSIRNA